MLGNTDVMEGPGQEPAGVGKDQNGTPIVTIINRLEDPFDPDFGTEFFSNFSSQSHLRALSGVDFAAGEFPESRVALVVRTPGDQNFLAGKDDGRRDQQRHFRSD